jgi:hypothetical protein
MCALVRRDVRATRSSPVRAEQLGELSGEVARVLGVADVDTSGNPLEAWTLPVTR